MSILVTGAGGFIGSHFLRNLSEKISRKDIIVLSRNTVDGYRTIVTGDYSLPMSFLSSEESGLIDTVFHLGAFIPKSGAEINDIDGCFGNITSTRSLLQDALSGLKRIIFASTIDVYGDTSEVVTESAPVLPSGLYGWSKAYCEQMIRSYCNARGIVCQVLRFGHVYGEGEEAFRKVIPIMIDRALKNEDITIIGDEKVQRTFIYVGDVAQSIINSANLEKSNVINIVGNSSVSVLELAETIIRLSGSSSKIVFADSKHPTHDSLFDNSLLTLLSLCDFTPLEIGLAAEIDYMRRKL